MAGPTAVVLVSPGPEALEATVSAVFRVWEEYEPSRIVVAPTERARRIGEEAVKAAAAAGLGDVRLRADILGIPAGRVMDRWKEALDKGIESALSGAGGEGAVLVVSPASRFLASLGATVGVRASQRGLRVEVATVYFYYGPWSGLPYPYTPRALEHVISIHPALERPGAGRDSSRKAPDASSKATSSGKPCSLSSFTGRGKLPPLRCAVAETARRLNRAEAPTVFIDRDLQARCPRLVLHAYSPGVSGAHVEADLCSPGDVGAAASRLARLIVDTVCTQDRDVECESRMNWLPFWLGLKPLRSHGGKGLESLGPLLVDTNLIYWGAHAYAWLGVPIGVPECALLELEKKASESLKPRKISEGASTARMLADLAAYLALQDLLATARLVPTPPLPDCDVAIPRLDPMLARSWTLATADTGVAKLWRAYYSPPSRELAEIDSNPPPRGSSDESPWREASWLYYALAQALALSTLVKGLTIKATMVEGGKRWGVGPAVGPLREALGLS